jgi:hypothetical protein
MLQRNDQVVVANRGWGGGLLLVPFSVFGLQQSAQPRNLLLGVFQLLFQLLVGGRQLFLGRDDLREMLKLPLLVRQLVSNVIKLFFNPSPMLRTNDPNLINEQGQGNAPSAQMTFTFRIRPSVIRPNKLLRGQLYIMREN